VSRNNINYLFVELLDGTSTLRCYCWNPEIVRACAFPEGALVEATFGTYDYRGNVRGRINGLEFVPVPAVDHILATLPSSLCPVPSVVERFRMAVSAIHEPLLREFVARAFADYALAKRYFRVPASADDHHAMPGGQAQHAVEMALDSARTDTLPHLHRDLAIVQAIFHDVGKTETHDYTPGARELFRMVDHEFLTLLILANPLRWLEATWPDGARALIVGWSPAWARQRRGVQPVVYPPAELVRGLDRTSRAASLCRDYVSRDGGLTTLSRHRAIWTPASPPATGTAARAGQRTLDSSKAGVAAHCGKSGEVGLMSSGHTPEAPTASLASVQGGVVVLGRSN